MVTEFTNEELLAYADERLPSERSVLIEQFLRRDRALIERMASL